ncbi:MAG TPA: MotA/TolQ/ExbB proton channel family protein [Kofleriaceae bacterium]|jgi:biopolymer transport protein ExbB
MKESIWELLFAGYGAMFVIVLFSIIALAVGIERAIAQWSFVNRANELGEAVNKALGRGAIEAARSASDRSPSPLADVFIVGFDKLGRVANERVVTSVHRERLRVLGDLKKRLWILGTVGATAPFIGLFGTVVGIMKAMGELDPEKTVKLGEISGPISSALVVTAVGIGVAVMSVVQYNYFSQRANRISTEMKLLTDEFLENLLDAPTDAQPSKGRTPDPEPAEKTAKRKGDDDSREAAA